MAITSKVSLEEWYYTNISEWTLDYPPFFAYFEWILSKVAAILDPSILALQSQPFYSFNTLIFQRLSVIVCDALYVSVFCNYYLIYSSSDAYQLPTATSVKW